MLLTICTENTGVTDTVGIGKNFVSKTHSYHTGNCSSSELRRENRRKSGFSIFFFHSFTIDVWHRMEQIYEAELHHWILDFYFTDLTNLQFPQNLEIFLFHHFAKRMRGVTGIFRPSFFLFSTPPHTTQNFLPFCTTLRLAWTLENFPWTTTDFFFSTSLLRFLALFLSSPSQIDFTALSKLSFDFFHNSDSLRLPPLALAYALWITNKKKTSLRAHWKLFFSFIQTHPISFV